MASIVDGDIKKVQERIGAINQRFADISGEEAALKLERQGLDKELDELLEMLKALQGAVETAIKCHQ